jgi:hypothetical protein
MPEKVTRQEKIISLAIEKARKAKEELSAKQRKNIEPTQVLEIDTDPEVEKIKRPKVQDASKITNQTQKKEGYGLAGESLKKQDKPLYQQPDKMRFVGNITKPSVNVMQTVGFNSKMFNSLFIKGNKRQSGFRMHELEELVEYAEKIAKHAPKLLEHMKSQLEKKSK